jgi:broad specificity phosphatase PhoE
MSACQFLETTMTTKEQIIHELDPLSETSMQQVLKFVRALKEFDTDNSNADDSENEQAYELVLNVAQGNLSKPNLISYLQANIH